MMRKTFVVLSSLLLLTLSIGCKDKKEVETVKKTIMEQKEINLTGKKVLMIIAKENFRDEEYFEPKKILSQAGIEIVTASSSLEEAAGMLGGKVKPDILTSDVKVDDYDAVIFVGGSGSKEYWNDSKAHSIAKETVSKGKILGAICIAPVTLANAGILKDKKATVFSSEKDKIIAGGAKYTGEAVQEDGNIITASGPDAAKQFGISIVTKLAE